MFKSCAQLSKSRQKLDVILENKVVKKFKFSKNVNNDKCVPNSYSSMEKIFRKIRIIFDIELKVRILPFLTTFTQLTTRFKNLLRDWLLILGLKEGLVECATVQLQCGLWSNLYSSLLES